MSYRQQSSRLSDGISQSQMDVEESPFYVYGMFFCGSCKNLLTPKQSNIQKVEKLQFDCKQCKKKEVDFSKLKSEQCIIYNKQLKPGSRITKLTKQMILDPTLSKVSGIECPQCGNEQAFYLITPGDGQNCIQIKLLCAGALQDRCQQTWVMDPKQYYLLKNIALPPDER